MALGGARPGAGRPAGVPNKATRDIKELCRGHGPAVIEGLLRLAKEADSDAAKIAASKEILDRAYGKATQMIGGDKDNPVRARVEVEFVKAAAQAALPSDES
jgi:hypothetical protein